MLFGIAAAMSVFLAMQGAANGLANPIDGVDPVTVVSLTITFFTIVSLRALLDVPSERLASWVFRSIVDHQRPKPSVAFKVLITQS